MSLRSLLLHLRPFSFSSSSSAASETATINTICRIISDHRSPTSDLETALLPFSPHLTPDLLDHLLRRLHHLPLPSLRLFHLSLSLPNFPSSPSPLSLLTLLHSLSSHHLFPLSWSLLLHHPPQSTSSFHILFFSYSKAHLPNEAVTTFRRIPDFNLTPDVHDLDTLLYSLCQYDHIQQAVEFFNQVKNQFKVTTKTYTILIAQSKNHATELFDEMCQRCKVDVAAYNALLGALCKSGEVGEAEKRFREMRRVHGLDPDAGSYAVFVRAYCVAGDEGGAMRMVENARRKGLVMNAFTFNCVIKLLCEKGKVEEAYRLLEEMGEVGVKPDAWSYNRIMSMHCRLHEVNKALRLMKRMDGDGCLPDRHTYNMLLKMLVGVGRIDRAEEVWEGMEGRGFHAGSCSYAVMIHGLCKKKGGAEVACRYFEEMIDEGIPPYDSTCMLLRGEVLRLGMKDKVYALTEKMRRSTSCTIQELSSVMEKGVKLEKKEEADDGCIENNIQESDER